MTGFKYSEWHSGFVMYRKDFLKKIPLQHLSFYRHIDGEFLMCAGILKQKTASVPIYKKYQDCDCFRGAERVKYIFHVFIVLGRFLLGHHRWILEKGYHAEIPHEFDILA